MQNQFSRTQLLLGKPAIDTLNGSRVAVFGVGGVGGYAVEVLARSGVGAIDVIDDDRVCLTNVNRQLLATTRTVGKHKELSVDVRKTDTVVINNINSTHATACQYLHNITTDASNTKDSHPTTVQGINGRLTKEELGS